MEMKTVSITLSAELVAEIKECMEHQRTKTTVEFFVEDAVQKFVTQQLYRYERNKSKAGESKQLKAQLEELKAKVAELTGKE
jgi:metal-responsive CopG/Arc/MetJ family transcriptional regulator